MGTYLAVHILPTTRELVARGKVELKAAHAGHCGLGYIHLGEEPFPYFHEGAKPVFFKCYHSIRDICSL